MNSMTGFGQGQAHGKGVLVRVELSSVNRKNLDVNVSLPRAYAALEAHCQSLIQKRLNRGRVQARIEVRHEASEGSLQFDSARAAAALKQANDFAAVNGLEPIQQVSDLLRIAFVPKSDEDTLDSTPVVPLCEQALAAALDGLETMRQQEGKHLETVLSEQAQGLQAVVDAIEPLVDGARAEMVCKLREAVASLGADLASAEPRLLQEIALYGERSDIREEVDRMSPSVTR